MRTKYLKLICILLAALFLSSCKPKVDPVSAGGLSTPVLSETASASHSPEPVPSLSPTPVPAPDLTGLSRNPLTGEYIDEIQAKKRPIAVVINNRKVSLPQSGISNADLFYEVLAEGDITRIVALYQDFQEDKVGSIRSARHYFLDFALDNDAILVHHGQSFIAKEALVQLKIDNINGENLDGTTFWRDPDRWKIPSMREHSSYTSAERVFLQIEKVKYRMDKEKDFKGMFDFFEKPESPAGGIKAGNISIPFTSHIDSYFEYDEKTKLYSKFQYGQEHFDESNSNQIKVTNVIIQSAKIYLIPNDPDGRREVELVSEGTGYLATNGVYVPITWKKASHNSPTEWFDAEGKILKLNIGKTYICVLQKSAEPKFNAE